MFIPPVHDYCYFLACTSDVLPHSDECKADLISHSAQFSGHGIQQEIVVANGDGSAQDSSFLVVVSVKAQKERDARDPKGRKRLRSITARWLHEPAASKSVVFAL